MRRLLALASVAAALVATVAAPASAEDCYGADEIAYACTDGYLVRPTTRELGACLYTGGSTCTPYYVDAPFVRPGDFAVTRVCVAQECVISSDPTCGLLDGKEACG